VYYLPVLTVTLYFLFTLSTANTRQNSLYMFNQICSIFAQNYYRCNTYYSQVILCSGDPRFY